MNQAKMKVTYRRSGELNNGDVAQCPACRMKFVVLPGTIHYETAGGVVPCPECAKVTPLSYYTANPEELPQRETKKNGKRTGKSVS